MADYTDRSSMMILPLMTLPVDAFMFAKTNEFFRLFKHRLDIAKDKIATAYHIAITNVSVKSLFSKGIFLEGRISNLDSSLTVAYTNLLHHLDKIELKTLIEYSPDQVCEMMDALDDFLCSEGLDMTYNRKKYYKNVAPAFKSVLPIDPNLQVILNLYEESLDELVDIFRWAEEFIDKMNMEVIRYVR